MKIRRGGRIVAYTLLTAAGLFATFGPPTLIENQVSGFIAQSWTVCLWVSALICLFGSITDRWIGEYSGLPLLFAVLGFFGIALLLAAREQGNIPLYAYSFTILSLSSKLVARWQDIRDVKIEAEHQGNMEKGG